MALLAHFSRPEDRKYELFFPESDELRRGGMIQTLVDGVDSKLDAVLQVQLLHDIDEMAFDRVFGH